MSLHALARRYQRAFDTSEAALLADLARLAGEYGKLLDDHAKHPGDTEFVVPLPTGGSWVGAVGRRFSEATGRDERIVSVSTFLQ